MASSTNTTRQTFFLSVPNKYLHLTDLPEPVLFLPFPPIIPLLPPSSPKPNPYTTYTAPQEP